MQAINRCELYVLHYPLLARVMGDATASGAYANKLMMAPIALFVATKNDSYPLKPVAIQLGHTGKKSRAGLGCGHDAVEHICRLAIELYGIPMLWLIHPKIRLVVAPGNRSGNRRSIVLQI